MQYFLSCTTKKTYPPPKEGGFQIHNKTQGDISTYLVPGFQQTVWYEQKPKYFS